MATLPLLGPDQKVSVPQAAKFIGASDRSLRRTIATLREGGEPSRASNGWQLAVAAEFIARENLRQDLTVRGLFEAIGLAPPTEPVAIAKIGEAPRKPKALRNRLDDLTEDLPPVENASDDDRRSVRDKLVMLKNRPGRPAWRQITVVVNWLKASGETPQSSHKGVSLASLDLNKLPRFASLGDFISQAAHDEPWLFVLSHEDGRPMDLFQASDESVRFGLVMVLDLLGYSRLMSAAIEQERRASEALREAEEIRVLVGSAGDKKKE